MTCMNVLKTLNKQGITLGLGTILVGSDSADISYVNKKHETCTSVGIESFHIEIPENGTQEDLLKAVHDFNTNMNVDTFFSLTRPEY